MPEQNELANAIRALAMDAVENAKSGHPGAPMGMADIATTLWREFLNHNPSNPKWINRDRFILSNGHGSMLLYALLHLSGYDLSIDDLKSFRQLHSKTPGHPEYGYTPGVETTTGPLGQGFANAVGMAIAEKTLAAQFNRNKYPIVDHHTYVFLGDGCMMEGISHEVASLAGRLKLSKLVAFYDDNGISIDGSVEGWFADDTVKRFEAYGWQVIPAIDGHDAEAIRQAIKDAQANTHAPTLICCKTQIGFGSPNKAGSASSHGSPLGKEEITLTKESLQWKHDSFVIPDDIYQAWDAKKAGTEKEQAWHDLFASYAKEEPALAQEFKRRMSAELPSSWTEKSNAYILDLQEKGVDCASRKASQMALNAFGPLLPELLGGSADLAGSNNTLWSGAKGIHEDEQGNYIYYGVREFGMSAIMNGLSLHGGFIPYGATFLVFMEYARNAVRMASLMKQQGIFVYTHDSIGLGEDGPTHQPIEQLANLRQTPNMETWRPADAVESAVCWQQALERKDGPSSLIFSRQTLRHNIRTKDQLALIKKGAYVLIPATSALQLLIIATGSEVGLAIDVAKELEKENIGVQVVSMPCAERFAKQPSAYQDSVLPPSITDRVAIEAGIKDYWYRWVGLAGLIVGMDSFGESAPAANLFEHFGLVKDKVVTDIKTQLINNR